MAIIVNMPRLGLTMTEGVIASWCKQVGDTVAKGDVLAEIESDKSVVPYEATDEGTLLKVVAGEGDTVECNQPIAILGEPGESVEDIELSGSADTKAEASEVKEDANAAAKAEKKDKIKSKPGERVFASPAAKRVARENGIDINDVPMTQGKVRIEKKDVLEYAADSKVKATPLAKKIAAEKGIDLADINKPAGQRIYSSDIPFGEEIQLKEAVSGIQQDTIIPVQGMRKVIAARMKESLEIAAHLTTVIDVDMTEITKLRESLKQDIIDKYDVKVSFNDVILKCVAAAIAEYPRVNCEFTEIEIIQKGKINLGMAVAVGEGLVVPVIRDANYLSLGQLASESKRLANKAKETGLAPDDMTGGTFTVSNLGMYGISSFTSIINQPESAILSIGGTQKKAIVTDDEQVVIKPMMTLTLSYDHRAMDGSMSAIFLKKLKDIMENPYKILI